jgi:predicted aldo/keto reductase-like oxidoreductase
MTDPGTPPRNAAPEVPAALPERWHDVYRLAAERSDFSATYCTPCFPAASNSNIVAMLAALADAERRAAQAEAERDRLRAALERIASWEEGPEVTAKFDCPSCARIARAALDRPEAGT